jgi:hypothetical protein
VLLKSEHAAWPAKGKGAAVSPEQTTAVPVSGSECMFFRRCTLFVHLFVKTNPMPKADGLYETEYAAALHFVQFKVVII